MNETVHPREITVAAHTPDIYGASVDIVIPTGYLDANIYTGKATLQCSLHGAAVLAEKILAVLPSVEVIDDGDDGVIPREAFEAANESVRNTWNRKRPRGNPYGRDN